MFKGKTYNKIELLDEPFIKNGRSYCKAKCNWCGKEFITQLRTLKKGKGCGCKKDTLFGLNKKFGKLTIIEFLGRKAKCRCDCGKIKILDKYNVMFGTTKSCGCEKKRLITIKNRKHNKCKTKLYSLYLAIKKRCYNKNSENYKWYGNKDIKICKEWLGEEGFLNFYNWATNNGYKDGLSIERIDISKDYSPSNCKWIPLSEQWKNTSRTVKVFNKGEIKFVGEISKQYNIPKSTLYSRIKRIKQKNKEILIKEEDIIGDSNIL